MLTLIVLYIAGYIAAYFLQKKFVLGSQNWSKKDRAMALVISSASLLGILIVGAAYLICQKVSDTPAKW